MIHPQKRQNQVTEELIAFQTAKFHWHSLAKDPAFQRPRVDFSTTIDNLYSAPLATRVVDRATLSEVVAKSENAQELSVEVKKTYNLMDAFLNRSDLNNEEIEALKEKIKPNFQKFDFFIFEALLDHVIANQNKPEQCKKLVSIATKYQKSLDLSEASAEWKELFNEIKKYEPAKASTPGIFTIRNSFLFILLIAVFYRFFA